MNTQKNFILINPISTLIHGFWLIIRFRGTEMRMLLLSLLISLALASCTLKLEDFRAYDEKPLYSTDFSQDEGKFRNHPGGTDGITEISDGALHVKGGPHELGSHMELKEPFGDNTITSFRVKTIKSDPEAFINFFMGRRGRLAIILRDTNIHIFADGPEAKFNRFLQKKGIIGGEWNDITVAIVNLEVMLFVDQILVSSFKVPEGLPPQGHLNFEGHSEFWIDDLKIRSVSRFERLE